MTSAGSRAVAMVLALLLTGAGRGEPIGFADLRQLIGAHPLHGVLAQYDREIAALRGTQDVSGLTDPAARAEHGAATLKGDAARAATRAQRIASSAAGADLGEESRALAAIGALRSARDRDVAVYDSELERETGASLIAFGQATADRTERAYEARRQQLHEKELTFAYDLARQDAPKRLRLRLKLDDDAYLSHATRAALRSELEVFDRREAVALSQMRRDDAATLANYWTELNRLGTVANARMNAQLSGKAAANLAIRQRASQAESNAGAAFSSLDSELAFFRSTYRSQSDASAIASGLHGASAEISGRFGQIAQADRESRGATDRQLARLESDRRDLYRAIVAQIERTAEEIQLQRHLAGVILTGSRPKGSVDLTAAVRSQLLH